jgi:hypothetical protein
VNETEILLFKTKKFLLIPGLRLLSSDNRPQTLRKRKQKPCFLAWSEAVVAALPIHTMSCSDINLNSQAKDDLRQFDTLYSSMCVMRSLSDLTNLAMIAVNIDRAHALNSEQQE